MLSVTLMHPAKAIGQNENEIPFVRDTRVVSSNTVLDEPRKGRFGFQDPQLAAMPPVAKLPWPFVVVINITLHIVSRRHRYSGLVAQWKEDSMYPSY